MKRLPGRSAASAAVVSGPSVVRKRPAAARGLAAAAAGAAAAAAGAGVVGGSRRAMRAGAVLRRPASSSAAVTSKSGSLAGKAMFKAAASKARLSRIARSALEEYEGHYWARGFKVVVGTDEAGRGPLAGPVVAAAFVVLDPSDQEVLKLLSTVNDSKKLSAKRRDELYEELTDAKFKGRTAWAIAEASEEEIDYVNILQASLAAMERSVRKLPVRADCVLVDGCQRPPGLLRPEECWTGGGSNSSVAALRAKAPMLDASSKEKWLPSVVDAIIKGDGKVASIGAASILAKVHRDRLMHKLHEEYPAYAFNKHMGYGTKVHMEALKKHGPCPAHRRSFAPVAAAYDAQALQAAAGEASTPVRKSVLRRPAAAALPAKTPEAKVTLRAVPAEKKPLVKDAGKFSKARR